MSDKTQYEVVNAGGTRRRLPPKPYRTKSERKRWKKARQHARAVAVIAEQTRVASSE